jgi:hypothetical protein
LCWFQVVETRGAINKGKVDHLAGDHQSRLHRGRLSAAAPGNWRTDFKLL